jgi:hypothetical protein
MILECRCFNEHGINAAAEALEEVRNRPAYELRADLLTDPALTQVVGRFLQVPKRGFASRWLLGVWLYRELSAAVPDIALRHHPGVWTWLAFLLFPIIRPPGTKVYEDARYIFYRDDFRKRYRHLVAGPYFVFSAHESEPHIVRGLLATQPHAPGDLYEQFASRQELITSSAVMQIVTQMYFDRDRGTLRSGASANARRLAEVLIQYDVTFDFATISPERLLHMLPREFKRFVHRI